MLATGARVEVAFESGIKERGVIRETGRTLTDNVPAYLVILNGPDVVRGVWFDGPMVRKLSLLELIAEAAQ